MISKNLKIATWTLFPLKVEDVRSEKMCYFWFLGGVMIQTLIVVVTLTVLSAI